MRDRITLSIRAGDSCIKRMAKKNTIYDNNDEYDDDDDDDDDLKLL